MAHQAPTPDTGNRSPRVAWTTSWWTPLPWALLVAFTLRGGFPLAVTRPSDRASTSPRAALSELLAARDITTTPDEIFIIDSPPKGPFSSLFGTTRALFRGVRSTGFADIYVARARMSPEGTLFSLEDTFNLTKTPSADEGGLRVVGDRAAYIASVEGVITSIHLLELDAAHPSEREPTSRLAALQIGITRLQETGQWEGVGHRGFSVDPSPNTLSLTLDGDKLSAQADARSIRIATHQDRILEGEGILREHPKGDARPGNFITWGVDRVRSSPYFGDRKMQALKAVVFAALDRISMLSQHFRSDASTAEIASDLGHMSSTTAAKYVDKASGFPPAPMAPYLTPPLAGEGGWVPLDADPFIPTNPGVPPAFFTSFIRTDRERPYTRIYVTIWDPRQIELHVMAGRVEPVGATGEAGPGLIPRSPEVMHRLVAAHNSGFQAMHGEFGVMSDGVVYLPPKPYGATIVTLKDGTTAFGTWPRQQEISDDVLSYRQNLTPLIVNQKYNPYNRDWWGGTPPGWKDKAHTVRSGSCLTHEHFIAYFYGTDIDASVLAQAMIQARCDYGIHLDMNAGHTGLEFYRTAPSGELPPLGRPLEPDWEAEGDVPGMPQWSFRARRMVRHMGLMSFPRYIHRDARDFFYLTLRPVLPGEDLTEAAHSPASPDHGRWRTRGLPQHGFPYAVAQTTLAPLPEAPSAVVDILRLDPHAVAKSGQEAPGEGPPIVAVLSGISKAPDHPGIWLSHGAAFVSTEPVLEGTLLFTGIDPSTSQAPGRFRAAAGVSDIDGMLAYVELRATAPNAEHLSASNEDPLRAAMRQLQCKAFVLLERPLDPLLGGTIRLNGEPGIVSPQVGTVRLVRIAPPAARPIFEDTPIVPPQVWHPLQEQRVRYFRKPKSPLPTTGLDQAPDRGGGTPSEEENTPKENH